MKATIANLQAQITEFAVLKQQIAQIGIVDQKLTALSTLVSDHDKVHDSDKDGDKAYVARIGTLEKD